MASSTEFMPEKLIIGVLSSLEEQFSPLEPILEARFGPIDYQSRGLDFIWTSYYDQEMGRPITRKFYSFTNLVDPSELAAIKLETNKLEERWAAEGNRKVNLDPGTLGMGRLILASTKGPGHRIALDKGIYAEITLYYRAKQFQTLPWTYPDFRCPEYHKIFQEIRELYHSQLIELGWDCQSR